MHFFITIIKIRSESLRLLVNITFTHVHASQDDDEKSLFFSVGSKRVKICRCVVYVCSNQLGESVTKVYEIVFLVVDILLS